MKNCKAQTIIIAEDIRAEMNNKFTLVGVTPSTIFLSKTKTAKFALHTIAAYAEFLHLKLADTAYIAIKSPSEEILSEGTIPIPKEDKDHLVLAGKFINVKFKESGSHRFIMKIDDEEFHKDFDVVIKIENS